MQSPASFLSLDTLIASSPLLGHPLEDRSSIRNCQDTEFVEQLQADTSTPLANDAQRSLFAVAPLDLLVTGKDQHKEFHLLELNGTGIGGLTNMSLEAVNAVMRSMQEFAEQQIQRFSAPLILVASSGKESEQNPRMNRLIYEKLMYAEAFLQGFSQAGKPGRLVTTASSDAGDSPSDAAQPTVVVGYIKDFLRELNVAGGGQLLFRGRPVTAMVNDRFCLNVIQQFHGQVDLSAVDTFNRCHLAGADKSVAYDLLNHFLSSHQVDCFPSGVPHEVSQDREQLIATVTRWRQQGLQPVIKPQGTGLGHGIEFFLHQDSQADVAMKIDRSIALTEEYYGMDGGAFPYTVCQYVDACTLNRPGHALHGHKYELRVVVYRDQGMLRAFPSIVKIAAEPPTVGHSQTRGLINNITASCNVPHSKGTDFMFPLANRSTLKMLELSEYQIRAVCHGATRYVRYVLDQVQQNPQRLGLPGEAATAESPAVPNATPSSLYPEALVWPTRTLI